MIFSSSALAELIVQQTNEGDFQLYDTETKRVIKQNMKVVEEPEEKKPEPEYILVRVDEENSEEDNDDILPVISLRAGVDTIRAGDSQNLFLTPTDTSATHFTSDNTWDTLFVWGALAGLEIPFGESGRYRWQPGIAFYSTVSDYEVDGAVNPNGSPNIVDYHYTYSVETQRIMFENKFLMGVNEHVLFYLLASVGEAINKATGFKYTSVDPAVPSNNVIFEDNTEYSLSYSFGLGIEVPFFESFRAGLGYQYSDFGKIKLGHQRSVGATSETLETDSTPAHEVIFNISYFFN